MKSSPLNTLLFSGLMLTIAMSSGCQAPNMKTLTSWMPFGSLFGAEKDVPWADKDNPAVRCVCLWQPAEGTWEGQSCRGFGGQVFFLDRDSARPIAVRGDIRIHVFDDVGPREDRAKPVHTFDFTKGAWNAFLVKTQFGPAYNIFIPYTRKGHEKTECALRIRMVEEGIPAIFSDMSYVRLEGSDRKVGQEAESVADSRLKGNETEKPRTGTANETAIGQIVNRSSASKNNRGLPPDVEARLAALRHKMPIKPRTNPDDSRNEQLPGGAEFPSSSANPGSFDPPAFASPISEEPRRQPNNVQNSNNDQQKARWAAGTESTRSRRHALAPAHPLVGQSSESPSIQQVHASRTTAGEGKPIFQGTTSRFERMIEDAQAAAARRDWALAIKLASRVDRAVRDENASWPVQRPTPSAMVAQWEIQRIENAAAGDRSQRDARIDSRVDDYLKASKTQLDQDKTSEARRLATVAHLISRGAVQSGRLNGTADAPSRHSSMTPSTDTVRQRIPAPATDNAGETRGRHPLDGNWAAPSSPPTRPAHPLESAGGFE